MLAGKVALITGGSKGIGAACGQIFVREHAAVAILDIDESGRELAKQLGDQARFYRTDVSKSAEVESRINQIVEEMGEIDVLVNNAGIQRYSTVTETSEEEWDLVMNVNLKSAFLCAKYSIPSMLRKGKGVVINVSSVQAFFSQQNVAPYTTSKTAMLGLTRSIAVDYSPDIRCVAVCPGTVDSPMFRDSIQQSPDPEEVLQECIDMHLLKKIGTPTDIAELIAFLASDRASFITGRAIRIDGGLGVMIGGSKRTD